MNVDVRCMHDDFPMLRREPCGRVKHAGLPGVLGTCVVILYSTVVPIDVWYLALGVFEKTFCVMSHD